MSDHHKAMMESLVDEANRMGPRWPKLPSWSSFDDEQKRKILRLLVTEIRESRDAAKRSNQLITNSLHTLGCEGIEALYELSPEEALTKARQILREMSEAEVNLKFLREKDLLGAVQAAAQHLTTKRHKDGLAIFVKGHEMLRNMLEQEVEQSTVLLACISRAGGAILTEEERAEMRAQWDMMVNMASSR